MGKRSFDLFDFERKISVDEARNYSPVVLAFIGDAVFSLYERVKYATSTTFKTGELNEITTKSVKGSAQAKLADKLLDVFTEEEMDVFKRGRNAKKPSKSKSCSVAEYNKSTGLEAVVGYLYLTGNTFRINELMEYENK